MKLGSLFDGSGGFPLGGIIAGITPVWSSEIEPFPIRVTEKRLPQMKHYGDVSKISGADLEPVDIITFGSPCQDMSVAGRRAGLDGARSGLFFQAVRIIKEMRAKYGKPRYAVWENVRGALSSARGDDFRRVLEEICNVKKYLRKESGSQQDLFGGTDTQWHGGFSMLSTGESPKDASASTLSQILMGTAPEKYYLSPRACQGILRRCRQRGKILPEPLKTALERQAGEKKS